MASAQELSLRSVFSPFREMDVFIRSVLASQHFSSLPSNPLDPLLVPRHATKDGLTVLRNVQNTQFGYHRAGLMTPTEMKAFVAEAKNIQPIDSSDLLPRHDLASYYVFSLALHYLVRHGFVNYGNLSSFESVDLGSEIERQQTFWDIHTHPEARFLILRKMIEIISALDNDPAKTLDTNWREVLKTGHFFAAVTFLSNDMFSKKGSR